MTQEKLTKLFINADNLMINFSRHSGPFEISEVSHTLFREFVTAAKRDLKGLPILRSELYWLGNACDHNKEKTTDTPALGKEECRAVIVCSAALAAKLG